MIETLRRRTTILAGLVATIFASFLLLYPIPKRWESEWTSTMLDLGHLPLFAALTAFLVSLLGRRWWVFVAVLFFAAMAEFLQGYVGRSGNFDDWRRSALGALMGLVLVENWSWRAKLGCIFLLGLWPAVKAADPLRDAIDAGGTFPLLVNFESPLRARRPHVYQATLERIRNPDYGWVGRLTFLPGEEPYSGFKFRPVRVDWTTKERLVVTFRVLEDKPIHLCLMIRDHREAYEYEDRFNFAGDYSPGEHRISIDLKDIAKGPRVGPPLDIGWIKGIDLYIEAPDNERSIDLVEIRLE